MRRLGVFSFTCGLVLAMATGVAQQRGAAPPPATEAPAAETRAVSGNVEHGSYLVNRVVMCFECHSGRDAQGNILPHERLMGGPIPFKPAWGSGWATRAPRIAGLPGYTTEQALRVFTQGAIGRDGNQLRAPMPRFRMTPEDATDVIAYLKSLGGL